MATTRSGASNATAEGADAGEAGPSCPADLHTDKVTVNKYSFGPGDGSEGSFTLVPLTTDVSQLDGVPRKVLYKQRLKCHRAAADKISRQPANKMPVHTKKVGCTHVQEWVVYEDEPDAMYAIELHGHRGHTPGDAEDMRYLNMDDELETTIFGVSIAASGVIYIVLVLRLYQSPPPPPVFLPYLNYSNL